MTIVASAQTFEPRDSTARTAGAFDVVRGRCPSQPGFHMEENLVWSLRSGRSGRQVFLVKFLERPCVSVTIVEEKYRGSCRSKKVGNRDSPDASVRAAWQEEGSLPARDRSSRALGCCPLTAGESRCVGRF